jgi:ribosomal protein S18 acetylase RimI-like enzyme
MTFLQKNIQMLEANPDDWRAIADLQGKMAWETEGLTLNPDLIEPGVQALLQDRNKGIYYKLLDNQQIIGCVMTTFEWSDWRNGYVIWIQSLYLLPDYRGRGLYKAMYQYLQAMVSESSTYKGIRLYVDKTNQAAIEVYKALKMNNQHYEMFEWMK